MTLASSGSRTGDTLDPDDNARIAVERVVARLDGAPVADHQVVLEPVLVPLGEYGAQRGVMS